MDSGCGYGTVPPTGAPTPSGGRQLHPAPMGSGPSSGTPYRSKSPNYASRLSATLSQSERDAILRYPCRSGSCSISAAMTADSADFHSHRMGVFRKQVCKPRRQPLLRARIPDGRAERRHLLKWQEPALLKVAAKIRAPADPVPVRYKTCRPDRGGLTNGASKYVNDKLALIFLALLLPQPAMTFGTVDFPMCLIGRVVQRGYRTLNSEPSSDPSSAPHLWWLPPQRCIGACRFV